MTTDDYRYITTLVLSAMGVQTAFLTLLLGLLYQGLNKRLELIEKRLDKLEEIRLVK